MARPETAQKKLDTIVTLIASNMVAEVCSLYVMRPGQWLDPGPLGVLGVGPPFAVAAKALHP